MLTAHLMALCPQGRLVTSHSQAQVLRIRFHSIRLCRQATEQTVRGIMIVTRLGLSRDRAITRSHIPHNSILAFRPLIVPFQEKAGTMQVPAHNPYCKLEKSMSSRVYAYSSLDGLAMHPARICHRTQSQWTDQRMR